MTPEDFARSSWQAGGPTIPLPQIEELRARADKFRRKIARRNLIEYIAGIFVIAAFGIMLFTMPIAPLRIGCAMVIGGTLVVLWQLHKRASPLSPPRHGGQHSVLAYQRSELARQRDALASVFSWYLLPLIPGMLVIMASPLFMLPVEQWQMPPPDVMIRFAFVGVVFGGIYWINQIAARRLQGEIDALDALCAE